MRDGGQLRAQAMADLIVDGNGESNGAELTAEQQCQSGAPSFNFRVPLTMAAIMILSVHSSLLRTTSLLTSTVPTERHMVVMAIHDTKFTTGPLCVAEIVGTRATKE